MDNFKMNKISSLGELNSIQRAGVKRRRHIALIIAPLSIGLTIILLYRLDIIIPGLYIYNIDHIPSPDPGGILLAIGSLILSGVGVLMFYLETGFRRSSVGEKTSLKIHSDAINILEENIANVLKRQEIAEKELREEILENTNTIKKLRDHGVIALAPDERAGFLATLNEQLQLTANRNVVEDLKKQWTIELDSKSQIATISEHLEDVKKRLTNELDKVNRRGNLNLSIGVITTLAGILILSATVFEPYKGDPQYLAILLHFLPKLSLVLFIEIFAYFFLRLYKASLTETRYFQNELTNIESKFSALIVALHRPEELGASAAIIALSGTERNFLLKQGESTVDIESLKMENENQKNLLTELRSFFRRNEDK